MNTHDMLPSKSGRGTGLSKSFRELQSEIDRLFSNFTGHFHIPGLFDNGKDIDFIPDFEVRNSNGEMIVTAELPGVDENDIDVSIADQTLTISGEKKSETRTEEDEFVRSERVYGSFSRSMSLPFKAEENAIKANFAKGVLTVTIPKPSDLEHKPKKIAVKAD